LQNISIFEVDLYLKKKNLLAGGIMRIFVVEDDKFYNKLIDHHLHLNPDFEVESFFDGRSFLNKLGDNPDIVTLDYSLPDINGDVILEKIRNYNPNIPVIIISGQEDVSTAINLLKDGAYDYIVKDENIRERLLNTIHNIQTTDRLKKEVRQLRTQISEKYDFSNALIGESKALKKVYLLIEKAIGVQNMTVSIRGETGTGKEMVARTIHFNSSRKDRPFVAVNMGAIPRELLESELFGHEKGAFTGAFTRNIGKFEEANGGTIFFDEIANVGPEIQTKLLRVIQEREFTRVGATQVIPVDVRILAATSRNLPDEIRDNRFREDLFYRLCVVPLVLPPLRQRREDIPLLAEHFLQKHNGRRRDKTRGFTKEALEALMKHDWPGNVRELENAIERAIVLARGDKIGVADLLYYGPLVKSENSGHDIVPLASVEKEHIAKVLRYHAGNRTAAARTLGIDRKTLVRKIRQYSLTD